MTSRILAQLHDKIKGLTSQKDRADCCIYEVPKSLRLVNWKAYTPQLISIGPIHHGIDKRLEGMEKQKVMYYKEFTERHNMDEEKIGNLVRRIQEIEKAIRASYLMNLTRINRSDFIQMILLDAVFIEFFQASNDDRGPKTLEPWMIFEIREDLMLLENQIPFFVIRKYMTRSMKLPEMQKDLLCLILLPYILANIRFQKRMKRA